MANTNTNTVTLDAGDTPPVVYYDDDGNPSTDAALLHALADSSDTFTAELGKAGVAAFNAAREKGQPFKSALGLAKLSMAQRRKELA